MYTVTFFVMVLVVWGVGSLIVHATMAPPEPTAVPNSHSGCASGRRPNTGILGRRTNRRINARGLS
jgi:hypothetical protein